MAQLAGVGRQFIKAAMNAPYLEREEEHLLAVRWKANRDQAALHKLAEAHMRLVIAIAVRFRHYGLNLQDLIQEGHVGLLEAAARFDPGREVRFSTYATWWIRASVQDFVLRNWSIVRGGTSSAQKSLFFNLRRLRAKLSQTPGLGSQSMFNTLADAIGVSRADVEWMSTRLSGGDVSLNAPLADSDSGTSAERVDFLADERPLADQTVEEDIDGTRRSVRLKQALTVLKPRELRILQARRLTEAGATLEALGSELGISKERVRQIESRAMEKLRAVMLEREVLEGASMGGVAALRAIGASLS